jgi:hypothetical protein
MKINEILHNELLDLPKKRNGKWFPDYIIEVLNQYITLTKNIEDFNGAYKMSSNEIHELIKRLCITIISSVNYYLNGHPYEAYDSIAKLLEPTTDFKENFCQKLLKLLTVRDIDKLYRIRIADPNKDFSRKEMFHVPFEYREKYVRTQRYSIPGFPCLYLANSIYVTWEELNKPDLNRIHASRFKPSENNNCILIDLAHPNLMRKEYGMNTYGPDLLDYIITWPLIFACSIMTEEKDNTFKPEYIIPQILMQFIRRNENIHGIKYFSNNVDYSKQNIGAFYNIAIPVVEMKEKGYCNLLKGAFKMTESISLQKIQASTGGQLFISCKNEKYNDEVDYIEIIKGKPRPYTDSIFHEIETQLTFLNANDINF